MTDYEITYQWRTSPRRGRGVIRTGVGRVTAADFQDALKQAHKYGRKKLSGKYWRIVKVEEMSDSTPDKTA